MAQAAGACAACRPLGVTVARLRPAVRLPQAAAAAHQRQLRQRRCPDRCCRVQASFDPYQKSPLFQSEVFQKEMDGLAQEMTTINGMLSKFGDFDLEGKRIFIDRMAQLAERFQVVMARLQLADDPLGNEMLRQSRIQMLEASMSMEGMMESYKAELADMRKFVDIEASTNDPATLAELKRAWKQKFEYAARLNPAEIFGDPELAAAALRPDAMRIVVEVSEQPSKLEKYKDDAQMYNLLKRILGV